MKFSIVVADPPWSFSDHLKMSDVKRGASSNYSTLTISELKSLPVKELSDPKGALLALWVPSALLQEGMDVMKAWGFNFKQTYIWTKSKKEPFNELFDAIKKLPIIKEKEISKQTIKNTISEVRKECNLQLNNFLSFGMGHLFRQSHEIALIGINNTEIYKQLQNRSQRSVSFAPNEKHSKKPEDLQNSLEIMFPEALKEGKMIELFARRERLGWICLGNEIGEKKSITETLGALTNNSMDNLV